KEAELAEAKRIAEEEAAKKEAELAEAKRIAEEEAAKKEAEKDALFAKIQKYASESEFLISDIKKYVEDNDNFDAITLGKLFLDFEKLSTSDWNDIKAKVYEDLRIYVMSSNEFASFFEKQKNQRATEYKNALEKIKSDLNSKIQILKKFITTNLGSDQIPNALELADNISGSLKEGSLDILESINNDVDDWLSLNDLLPSKNDEETSGNSTPPSAEEANQANSKTENKDTEIASLSFTVKAYSLTKEVGDGFDNFEAGKNQYLLPIMVSFEDRSDLEKISVSLELDLGNILYPDPDASLAFGSQEGVNSMLDINNIKTNSPVSLVFIFPMENIELETSILKFFENNKLIGQQIINFPHKE
ncbi:MAG: hypothetical protein ACJ0BS_01555, partial [Paracoccaceae bacterium]